MPSSMSTAAPLPLPGPEASTCSAKNTPCQKYVFRRMTPPPRLAMLDALESAATRKRGNQAINATLASRCSLGLLCTCLLLLLAACGSGPAASQGSTPTPTGPTPTPTPAAPTLAKALVTYSGHSGPVITAVWSPDGKRIASGGNHGTVQVWDAQTGKQIWKTHIDTYSFAIAWSPDGKRIAGAGAGSVEMLDAATGKLLATFTNGQASFIERLAWSPDGKEIASASNDGTVQVWDAKTGTKLLTYSGNGAPVWSVAWSPDGKRIVSGTGAAGDFQSVTSGNTVKVWDATTGQTLLTYQGHQDHQVYALAWSPDGTKIASGSDDKTVQVWNAATGQPLLIYQGHSDIVFGVAWSPNGKEVASASVDGTVQVWQP